MQITLPMSKPQPSQNLLKYEKYEVFRGWNIFLKVTIVTMFHYSDYLLFSFVLEAINDA